MIGIYKITSPTGRVYIGQSVDIKRRFRSYKALACKTSVKLYRSFLKHGVANHKFSIVEACSKDQLNEIERLWQENYNATSPENLNCILTETDCKKRVIQPISDKQKAQISAVHKGKVYGEATRARIKAARAKQIITQEHRNKISENSGSARLVLNLQTGIFYRTAKEAAIAHGIISNTLIGQLIGRNKNRTSLMYV